MTRRQLYKHLGTGRGRASMCKGPEVGPFSEGFHIGEPDHFHVPLCQAPSSMKTELLCSGPHPYVSLPLAVANKKL